MCQKTFTIKGLTNAISDDIIINAFEKMNAEMLELADRLD